MRIQWLNSERTAAKVTRGFLWWRKVSYVNRGEHRYRHWRYDISDKEVSVDIEYDLEHERDWFTPGAPHLPEARLLK